MIDLFDYLTIFLTLLYTAAVLKVIGGIFAASNKGNRYIVHLILILDSILSIVSDIDSYGQYDWCIDGAIGGNNRADNCFALVDHLFDETNDESGDVNVYRW